jgi:stage V sporulation protein SpoVS
VGIRAFLHAHPPGPGFTDLVARARVRAAATGHPRSPVGACAAVLLEEGQRGVRAVAAKVAEGTGVAAVPDAAAFRRARPEDLEELAYDLGALLLGATLLALEDALVTRAVDLGLLRARVNAPLAGTPFPPLAGPAEASQPLAPEEWAGMLAGAARDKTFAAFFAEGAEALPPGAARVRPRRALLPATRRAGARLPRARAAAGRAGGRRGRRRAARLRQAAVERQALTGYSPRSWGGSYPW